MRLCYVHLPRFPVQRRVVETPALTGRPFALEEEVRGQRRIVFASSAAMRDGVRPGMTVTAAAALSAALLPFPFQPAVERAALASLGESLLALGPEFQLCPPDGLWLSAAAAHLFGGEHALAERAIALCAQRPYQARAVVADNPFTARLLARHGGVPVQVVGRGQARAALASVPLTLLDGPEAARVPAVQGLGLTTLGEVAGLPGAAVVARLGAEGLRLQRLCRGEDETLFAATRVAEVVEETLALDWPAESTEPVLFALKTTLDRLCARLAGRRRAAVRLSLTLKLDPSGERTLMLSLARPTAQGKLLLELAKHRIADLTLGNPVAGVHVRVEEDCEDPGQQLGLGDRPTGDASLEVVLSRLATALGGDALFAAELAPVHRPEAAFIARAYRLGAPQSEHGLLAEARGGSRTGSRIRAETDTRTEARGGALARSSIAGTGGYAVLGGGGTGGYAALGGARENDRGSAALVGGAGVGDRGSAALVGGAGVGDRGSAARGGGAGVGDRDSAALGGGASVGDRGSAALGGSVAVATNPRVKGARRLRSAVSLARAAATARAEEQAQAAREDTLQERPVRLFPRPAPLEAELGPEGALEAVRLLGKRRRVVAISPPERLSGEWWAPDAFERDYYRVHFEGLGPVWIYRDGADGRLYLQGMFD